MASAAVQNPVPSGESKSARKKKAKADAAANGPEQPLADPVQVSKDDSNHAADGDEPKEHPYISSLAKQTRNLNKKLSALAKSDAIVAENKGVSLDDLVAQKKLNNDQRASLQKKPQIQQQLAELQEQIGQYRKFDADYQSQLSKQKAELEEKHEKETAELRERLQTSGVETGTKELKSKLLIFSQFLRCAAAKRIDEANQNSPESRAFEGALLYVYGGDDVAVETALKVIDGSDEMVPSIDEEPLGVKFSQIKQTSTTYAPFQSEESWVDSVAEANASTGEALNEAVNTGSDPTINHAGLTELSAAGAQTNGVPAQETATPTQGDAGDAAGNAAGDRWDTTTAGGAEKGMEDSFEMVPRPNEEVDTPAPAPYSAGDAGAVAGGDGPTSWADESTAAATSNQAGEGWDMKAAGQSAETAVPDTNNGWADGAADAASATPAEDGDGFQSVGGRHRGGRGRGRGDGEFRGRGRGRGGFRGDGEFRGRGRGGFRGGRGGEGGEFRGRGRGGRGQRGDGPPRA